MEMSTLIFQNENETASFGAQLAPLLRAGDVVCLEGTLGAGKTTLARGLIRAFCGEENVSSPTFTMAEIYQTATLTLWHFDLYRLERPEDVWELGIEDAFDNGVSLIEWPERIAHMLPENRLCLAFDIPANGGRKLHVTAPERLMAALRKAGIA